MAEEIEKIETLIIGSGPAGYSAAIYAARADLKPVVIQGLQPGGQLTTTTEVDNYPGYPNGVDGTKMMEDFKAQAERFDTDTRWGMVTKVDLSERPFKVEIDEKTNVLAETIIISTGASAKWLGIDDEKRLLGTVTDGDLRRSLLNQKNITTPIFECMSKNPITLNQNQLAIDAVNVMESSKVNGFIVIDDKNNLIGILNLHILLKHKII